MDHSSATKRGVRIREEGGRRGSMWILYWEGGVSWCWGVWERDEPLDVFDVVAEVGGVVDFIFEELLSVTSAYALQRYDRSGGSRGSTYDPSDLIPNEIPRLIHVPAVHQEITPHRPR